MFGVIGNEQIKSLLERDGADRGLPPNDLTNPSVIGGMANSLIRACKTNFGRGEEAGIMIFPQ